MLQGRYYVYIFIVTVTNKDSIYKIVYRNKENVNVIAHVRYMWFYILFFCLYKYFLYLD